MLKKIRLFILKVLGGVDKSEVDKAVANYIDSRKRQPSVITNEVKPNVYTASLNVKPGFLASLTEDEAKDFVYKTLIGIIKDDIVNDLDVTQMEDYLTHEIKFNGKLIVVPCNK